MAQINKPTDYFNTKLYAGNSGTQSITGVGFQPDFLWIKRRTLAGDNNLVDVIRTSDKTLISNSTGAEYSNSTITSFDSDGFSLSGSDGALNASSNDYASWNWLASNTTASNTDGSISSTVSANTTSGFSIVKYTGTGANATVGHGLGVAPKMIHVKGIDVGTTNWLTGGSNISSNWGSSLHLNTTGAIDTYNYWQNQAPNANTFALSTDGANNQSGINFIAYCFAEKKGYSKFGSYTGNGNANGTFVYTGFKPAFVIIKRTDITARDWFILDNKRDAENPVTQNLKTNSADAEVASERCDFLSNGFKLTTSSGGSNGSGGTFIYMAFAEAPLVGSNNVPCTAR